SATSWERRDWPRCCASCVELQFDSTQACELRPILARARKAWRAGAAPGRNDVAGTQAPARRLRIGEQDDSTERIAFEDGSAAALRQLGDAPIWSGPRQDHPDRPEGDPRAFARAAGRRCRLVGGPGAPPRPRRRLTPKHLSAQAAGDSLLVDRRAAGHPDALRW